jgi:signal transduction histidine kinase
MRMTGAKMVRAMSTSRKDVLAFTRDTAALGHRFDLRRIAMDRTLHAALALAHLTLAVAFTAAMSDVIGPFTGAGLCLSAAGVAVMLMLRAAETSAPTARPRGAQTESRARLHAAQVARAHAVDCTPRDLSGLLAMMSHELRTPLNAIIGNADAIRCEAFGPAGAARYRECASHIREGGQLLLRATEDMMALTGAVAAATFAPHHPVDLADAVRDALRQSADTAKSKGVDLSWQAATDRAVLSEAGALGHAIARIIDGALARATAGASIHVELMPGRGTVELMLTLTHGATPEAGLQHDDAADRIARIDSGADRSPAALQLAVARTLLTLLGTHLHTAHGIDGRWRAIVELPEAPAH